MKNNLKIQEATQGNWRMYQKNSGTFRKAAIAIAAVVLLMVLLTSCIGTGVKAEIIYFNLEEMQTMWPNYYYWDFGQEAEFRSGAMLSSQVRKQAKWEKSLYDYKYYEYVIGYNLTSIVSEISEIYFNVTAYGKTPQTIKNINSVPSGMGYKVLEQFSFVIDEIHCEFY